MKVVTPNRHPAGLAGLVVSLAALIIALLGPACGEAMDSMMGIPSDCNQGRCPTGEVCTSDGACVPEVTQPMTISFRLVPPEDSGLLEEHLIDLAVNGTADLGAVRFHQPVTIDGRVFFADDEADDFAGRVTFSLQESLRSLPIRTDTVVGDNGLYAVALVPGTYQVTVRADDVPIPPFRIDEFVVENGGTQLDIQLPNPDDHYLVEGQCVRRRPEMDDDMPIAGARVTLVSITGVALSTSTDTSGEGNFSVTALPSEPEYMVRIGPGEMNGSVPELLLGPIEIAESTDLGVLVVGEWEDLVEVTGAVSGQNGVTRPVSGTTVFFRHHLELGTFSQLSRADENGRFSASLIPGDYHVVVAPPADEPYGADSFYETLYEEGTPPAPLQNPTLSTKPDLSGVVTGPSGALENAVLSVEPTGYDVSLLALGPVSTATSYEGQYELPVHPGTQRIVVQPPAGLGLAPILTSLDAVQQDSQFNVRLERASQLSGTVLSPTGAPLQMVAVEAFVGFDDEMVSFSIIETDENGYFVIDLPQLGN